MKLEIPFEFTDGKNRTAALVKISQRGFKPTEVKGRTFKTAGEVAAKYGCAPYKRTDWEKIAHVPSHCLLFAISDMSTKHGLYLEPTDVHIIAMAIRNTAGQYLSYTGETVSDRAEPRDV